MLYTEGEAARLSQLFVDEHEQPLEYSDSYPPVVRLYQERELISEAYATVDTGGEPGTWVVEIPIPNLGLYEQTRLQARWRFTDSENGSHTATQYLDVAPESQSRIGDIVYMYPAKDCTATMPFVFTKGVPEQPANLELEIPARPGIPGDQLTIGLFSDNNLTYPDFLTEESPEIKLRPGSTSTSMSFPCFWDGRVFEPALLVVSHFRGERIPVTYTFNVWPSNSSILGTAKMLEDFLNKAHLKNVIPELDYTQGDLLQYLARGLGLFNQLEQLTSFTGTNMKGYMQDAWLTCASYYALASQLQAEGALAFDFSGQTVSLNVDRTPAIESALGRVESQLENIKTLKKRLANAGIVSGDGSNGASPINGANRRGVLGLTNAPTTRLPYSGRSGSWFRPMF